MKPNACSPIMKCALIVAVSLAVSGCAAQSEMAEVWHEPTLAPNTMHRVLVVAIRKDPIRRRVWEDALAAELTARGIAATPSYQSFADAPPDTEQVIAAVRSQGYDAVMTSVRLADDVTTTYVPGVVRSEPYTSRDYYGGFHRHWMQIREPGYTETDTVIRVRTDVWETTSAPGRLVWSGTLRTREAATSGNIERAARREIAPALEAERMIPRRSR